MKNIKNFERFNEGIGSWFKGLITGEKTEDDKISKNLLKNVDNIEFKEDFNIISIFYYQHYIFSKIQVLTLSLFLFFLYHNLVLLTFVFSN